jgi:zinc protease
MNNLHKFTLKNGLKVLFNKDNTSPIVALNIIYNVGAKDENPNLTGFAHLFEHLMFGGSINIPKYDLPLEKVGGENNAFTNNDFTNYYLTIPKENIETGFWLESDRMLNLAFNKKSLEVQRKVVIEEYKQRYLNQPYGDIWLLIRSLVYKYHPYQWATIGKDISHIEKAKMADVKAFYTKFYNPNNAILSVVGDMELQDLQVLCEKWFEPIPAGEIYIRNLSKEPTQNQARFLEVTRDVPVDVIFKVYRMCDRLHPDFYATDLLSDILSNGKSSRLYLELLKKQNLFSQISAFISGDIDEGMFVVAGYLNDGIDFQTADKAISTELEKIYSSEIPSNELQKVKNKVESALLFSELSNIDKAMNLGYYELLGDADLSNFEIEKYSQVSIDDIKNVALNLFKSENCSTLFYKKSNTDTQPE